MIRHDSSALPGAPAGGRLDWAAAEELLGPEGIALSWAASTPERPFANLGDALSPVVVSAMSRLPIVRRDFDYAGPRLAAVGTIAHGQLNGSVHVWGAGMDGRIDPTRTHDRYLRPPDTRFTVHATRGPYTRGTLLRQDIPAPPIYGDPVWFLPRLMPRSTPPTHELGVVLHLTELEGYSPQAAPKEIFKRYEVPPSLANQVKIISPITDLGVASLEAKVAEILACRRIASTSLHGLVIAETYGIPCVWFSTRGGAGHSLHLQTEGARIDHRVRDFYAGSGVSRVAVYGSDRNKPSRWDEVTAWIDRAWTPMDYDAKALFDAYPLPKAVSFDDASWPIDRAALAHLAL